MIQPIHYGSLALTHVTITTWRCAPHGYLLLPTAGDMHMRPIAYFDENMEPITVTMQDLQKEVQDDANLTAYEEMQADAVSDFM